MNVDNSQPSSADFRSSMSTQDSASSNIKNKFKSVISRASRSSNANSLGASTIGNTPRGSFQTINSAPSNQQQQHLHDTSLLMNTTGSSGSSGDDEDYSGENTMPDQLMNSKDDLEYFRNYYKQQQEQSPRRRKSRMLEDLDTAQDSFSRNKLPGLQYNSNLSSSTNDLQHKKLQIIDAYSANDDSNIDNSTNSNDNVLEKSISGTSSNIESMVTAETHQHKFSGDEDIQHPYEDEEIERLKQINNSSNINENPSNLINHGKRNISQSSMHTASTTETSTTNESFHSAVASLGQDEDSTQINNNNNSFNNSEKFSKFIAKPSMSATALGSTSSNHSIRSSDQEGDATIHNNYSNSSLGQVSNKNQNEQVSDNPYGAYYPQSNRTSIAMSNSNRNTKTQSFYENILGAEEDADHHPLPDITKYDDTFNFNINDMDDDDEDDEDATHKQVINGSNTDLYSSKKMDISENAIAGSKRNSEVLDNNNSSTNNADSSRPFYYESEEPVSTAPNTKTNVSIPPPTSAFGSITRPKSYISDSSSRKSKNYSEAQTKFPLLSMIGQQSQVQPSSASGSSSIAPIALPSAAPGSTSSRSSSLWGKRTTTYSMNSSSNNNNAASGSNRYSYQTNITEPSVLSSVTYSKPQPSMTSPPLPYFDPNDIQQQAYGPQGYVLEEDEDVQLPQSSQKNISSAQQQHEQDVSSPDIMIMPPYLNNSGSAADKINDNYKINSNSSSPGNAVAASSAVYAAAASVVPRVPSGTIPADIKQPTIVSTTDGTDHVKPSQYYNTEDPQSSFRAVSQQQHVQQQRFDHMGDIQPHSQRYSANYQLSRHSTKFKARPFHLKPGSSQQQTPQLQSSPHRAVSSAASVTSPLMATMFEDTEKYAAGGDQDARSQYCPESTIWALLMISFFVPPLYLVICFGFLDQNVGYISRKYKMIACFMSMAMLVGSVVGICVGLGVGLTRLS